MTEFKVGQEIKCIDAAGAHQITEGKKYKILYDLKTGIYIKNNLGDVDFYFKDRFKLITKEQNNDRI